MKKTLIYGYGNPGRQDDAIGIMLVEKLEHWAGSEGYDWISLIQITSLILRMQQLFRDTNV